MGVDMLDITFRLEKKLGLQIDGAEFWNKAVEDIETSPGRHRKDVRVSRLLEVLCELTGSSGQSHFDVDLSRQRMIEALQSCFDIAPGRLTLETKLCEVIPRQKRSVHWERLAVALGQPLPTLQRPVVVRLLCGLSVFAAVVSCGWLTVELTRAYCDVRVANALGTLCIGFTIGFGILWHRPRPTQFLWNCQTIDDLAQCVACCDAVQIARQNAAAIQTHQSPPHPNPWTRDMLWRVLHEVLVDVLGVDDDEVVPQALLVRDLGCE